MSLLDKVQSGVNPRPPKLMIAGTAGVGKSTFAADAPGVLFIEAENRTDHLDIDRFHATAWKDIIGVLKEIPDSGYQTVVFDTVDAMELLILEYIAKKHNVESYEQIGGGYFQYRAPLINEWKRFLRHLDTLSSKGIQCILIAHTHIKTFTPPGKTTSDRYTLKMDARSGEFLIENMDLVGFAHFQTFVQPQKGQKAKATTTNKRMLEFKYDPIHPGKQGVPIADKCELSWKKYQESLV